MDFDPTTKQVEESLSGLAIIRDRNLQFSIIEKGTINHIVRLRECLYTYRQI